MPLKYKLIQKRNPQDKDAPTKTYALAVHEDTFNLKQIAREVAGRSTTASAGDVFAVIIELIAVIKEHLERSDRVVIDGIGSFELSLKSEGAESEEKFYATLIQLVRMLYKPDMEMKDFLNTIKLEKVAKKKT